MRKEELVKMLRNGMFADRPSISEALEYVNELAQAAGRDGIAVLTAVYVTLNTVANEIEKIDRDRVSIQWCWEDIQSLRPEWDEDKCVDVLSCLCKDIKDRSVERGWEVIEYLIDDYDEQPEGGLKVGDRVWWTDPDNNECSSLGTVLSIKREGEDAIVTILEEEAGEAEVPVSELRFVSRGGE